LFNEPKLAPGLANQTVTFATDFGVNFGLFTCFDILYWNPSRTVLANGAVRDVVYPTSWFSTTPFYASLTVQHGYAVSTGVNLLAANYGVPPETHGGSGIYLPDDKTAKIYLDAKSGSKLVIQNVPNQKNKQNSTCISAVAQHLSQESNISNYVTLRNFEALRYKFRRVNLAQKNQSVRICDRKFCCTFDLSVDTQRVTPSDIFKVMAFDGVVPFDRSTAHIRVCSLVACRDDSDESCGVRVTTGTKFNKMAVYGNFEKDNTTFYTPLTLTYDLLPITKSLFCDNKRANGSIELSTTELQQNVLVFGLFGRTNSIIAE
jgi:pantetheine hydrolase